MFAAAADDWMPEDGTLAEKSKLFRDRFHELKAEVQRLTQERDGLAGRIDGHNQERARWIVMAEEATRAESRLAAATRVIAELVTVQDSTGFSKSKWDAAWAAAREFIAAGQT